VSLSAWATPAEGSLPEALARLRELPRAEHGLRPPPPLVVGSKDAYHAACVRAGYPGHLAPEIKAAPIVAVDVRGLHTIQRSVKEDRVAQYLRDPGLTPKNAVSEKHGGPVGYPIVVQAGGVRYLHDGHHRTVAEVLRGGTQIRARFVDLDAGAPAK